MDTILLPHRRAEKTVASAAGLGIVFCILLSQNLLISAKDLGLGSYTGISPTLNYIIEDQNKKEQDFKEYINNKYVGSNIVDVEKGVSHVRMIKYYNGRPVRINIVELSTGVNESLSVEPAIASNTLASRAKISSIAKRENAIAAINGGYFKPQTGVPLGTLMINKKVYTGPIYDRVAMGIFDNGYSMARLQLKASVETNIGGFKIDNVNQPRMLSTHTIVYTRDWGKTSPISPKYGTQLVVSKGKLVGVTESSVEIPQDGFVIVGPTKYLEPLIKAKRFKLKLKMNPEWEDVNHIISGGPYLVKNNEIYVDMTAQKLSAIGGRNPRTAIGYTKDNNLIMLTADGREGASIGLTLMELANLMKELGCVNAMNLDGGGSTVMYVQGQVVNKPAEQGGIPLSHTLTVVKKDYT
ncbi:MAG: phosphodiester glycosidase family protein [Cyanobacteria bacterium SIG31]|nr:phosphodiester glycosidase family protein [Cyanobacteria bacterium SIG31]